MNWDERVMAMRKAQGCGNPGLPRGRSNSRFQTRCTRLRQGAINYRW